MKNSEFEKFDKRFNRMFKVAVAFIVAGFCAVVLFWTATAYLVVTKGPETVHRAERVVDAYANKLEQETQNNKKSE